MVAVAELVAAEPVVAVELAAVEPVEPVVAAVAAVAVVVSAAADVAVACAVEFAVAAEPAAAVPVAAPAASNYFAGAGFDLVAPYDAAAAHSSLPQESTGLYPLELVPGPLQHFRAELWL